MRKTWIRNHRAKRYEGVPRRDGRKSSNLPSNADFVWEGDRHGSLCCGGGGPRRQHIDVASREPRTSISWHSFWGCSRRKMQSYPRTIGEQIFCTPRLTVFLDLGFGVPVGPGVPPDERVCIPRGERQPQCRPAHRGRPAHTQRMVQLPEVHPRTVRPTKRSPRAQNPDAKSRGTQDNAVRLRHVEPARVPLRHAAPGPSQVLDSLHRLVRAQSSRPPISLS